VAIDREVLEGRLDTYFDPTKSDGEVAGESPGLMIAVGGFDPVATRRHLLQRGMAPGQVIPYAYRPFDRRFLFWDSETRLLDRSRPDLKAAREVSRGFLACRPKGERSREGAPFLVTGDVADHHFIRPASVCFPMMTASRSDNLLEAAGQCEAPNLTPGARSYLTGLAHDVESGTNPVWFHALAIGHSEDYLAQNVGAVRHDWPRIPLPASADALVASADLGRMVAALLDVESPVDTVTVGAIRYELRPLGLPWKANAGQIDPSSGDLAVLAGWGHTGQGGVTMPGRGCLVERTYTPDELALIREGLADLGLSFEQLMRCLGGSCVDVYLNERTYWRCVPSRVWTFTIGGYQVIKKWLSYRERPLLGRDLTVDEARYVTEIARRIAAILLLEPALDANYEAVKAETYAWSHAAGPVP
jgi:hypothetical protein